MSQRKRVFGRAKPFSNVFHLGVHFHASQTHFHMKIFARTRFEIEAESN